MLIASLKAAIHYGCSYFTICYKCVEGERPAQVCLCMQRSLLHWESCRCPAVLGWPISREQPPTK